MPKNNASKTRVEEITTGLKDVFNKALKIARTKNRWQLITTICSGLDSWPWNDIEKKQLAFYFLKSTLPYGEFHLVSPLYFLNWNNSKDSLAIITYAIEQAAAKNNWHQVEKLCFIEEAEKQNRFIIVLLASLSRKKLTSLVQKIFKLITKNKPSEQDFWLMTLLEEAFLKRSNSLVKTIYLLELPTDKIIEKINSVLEKYLSSQSQEKKIIDLLDKLEIKARLLETSDETTLRKTILFTDAIRKNILAYIVSNNPRTYRWFWFNALEIATPYLAEEHPELLSIIKELEEAFTVLTSKTGDFRPSAYTSPSFLPSTEIESPQSSDTTSAASKSLIAKI